MISVFYQVDVGKGEYAGSHFSTTFSKGFFLSVVKTWDCVVKKIDGLVPHYPKCLYKAYALRIVLHSAIEITSGNH